MYLVTEAVQLIMNVVIIQDHITYTNWSHTEITNTLKIDVVISFIQIIDEDDKTTSKKPTSDKMMANKSINSTETSSSEGK